MAKVYVKFGVDIDDVQIISTNWTADTQTLVTFDEDSIDLTKLEGYKGYVDEKDNGTHVKFDQDKYDAHLAEVKKQQEEEKRQKELEEAQQAFLDSITIEYKESDKEGYKLKCYKIGGYVFKEVYVEEDEVPMNDGSDYTRPITYKEGMSVEKGLWYTNGTSVWECIKEGTPSSFSDKEYFDIIE